jgi:hypothetical protein
LVYPLVCPCWNAFCELAHPPRKVESAGYAFFRPIWIVADASPDWISRPYYAYCNFIIESLAGRIIE